MHSAFSYPQTVGEFLRAFAEYPQRSSLAKRPCAFRPAAPRPRSQPRAPLRARRRVSGRSGSSGDSSEATEHSPSPPEGGSHRWRGSPAGRRTALAELPGATAAGLGRGASAGARQAPARRGRPGPAVPGSAASPRSGSRRRHAAGTPVPRHSPGAGGCEAVCRQRRQSGCLEFLPTPPVGRRRRRRGAPDGAAAPTRPPAALRGAHLCLPGRRQRPRSASARGALGPLGQPPGRPGPGQPRHDSGSRSPRGSGSGCGSGR